MTTLERREAQFTVVSQGVGAHTETTLAAEVSGIVRAVSPKFVAGGVFDQGEVLWRIDRAKFQNDVLWLSVFGAKDSRPCCWSAVRSGRSSKRSASW